MVRIKIRLHGKLMHDLALSEEKAYIIGRKETCDIVLQSEPGISREHLRVSFQQGQWQVEMLSKYGDLLQNGDSIKQLSVVHGTTFAIIPYEFEFSESEDIPVVQEQSPELNLEPEQDQFSEKTFIGIPTTVAFIKLLDFNNEPKELINLDSGNSWFAGRDRTCQIVIADQRVSRRQFEIRKIEDLFFIIDLGSVNGTLLNGTPISSSDPVQIKSGDSIAVLDNNLIFELHDANFQNQLQLANLPSISQSLKFDENLMPVEYQHTQVPENVSYQGQQQWQVEAAQNAPTQPIAIARGFDFEKNRPKLILGAVAILVFAFILKDNQVDSTSKKDNTLALNPIQSAFSKLPAEQQTLIRQRYKDAKNMYMTGKYQLAQDEIAKIKDLIQDYEDIKEIERLSKEAMFIQEQQRRQDEIEKAKAEAEEKIQQKAIECKARINPDITESQFEDCISSVLQFNPDHPRINELRNLVRSLVSAKADKEVQRAAYQGEVNKLKVIFDKAEKMNKSGLNPLDVIDAFQSVIESKLPDPGKLRDKARFQISSIKQMMANKTLTYQEEADKHISSGNLKEAILALRKARQVDPLNQDLPPRIEKLVNDLRKQMMNLYQEGILEESFGNVDGAESKVGAKDKWRKILELDITDGEYFKKAYIKLKKYGAL